MTSRHAPSPAALAALLSPLVAGLAGGAAGADFDSLGALSPEQFERLAENLGAATHNRAIAPAESLGTIGADVSLELSSTDVDDALFALAGDDLDLDTLLVPRLHVQKGLPFGLDVGAMIAAAPEVDATVLGLELRYAVVEGGVATPAVSVRGSYSSVRGIDELDLDNYGLELAVSKGFLMFTPYIGVGVVRTEASAPRDPELEDVSTNQRKVFGGLNVNVGVNFGVEVDRTGDYTTYSAKVGVRF